MVKRKSGPAPYKRWCFTLNNPTPEEERDIREIPVNLIDYMIVGREVGERGTPHLQGFINFAKKKTMPGVKAMVGVRAHVEKAKGTDEQNRDYCSKDGDVLIEVGAPRVRGARTDLQTAVSTLIETRSLKVVAERQPEVFVKYYRGLGQLIKTRDLEVKRDWKTQVHVAWGPPGCGKSRWARQFADESATYWKSRGKWWDGYTGQEVVVLDDFYGWVPYDELLRLCDRYPLIVETKGGSTQFLARTLLITSNKGPQEWYSQECVPIADALYRRITTLIFWLMPTGPSTGSDWKKISLPHPDYPQIFNKKINY